MSHQEFTKQYNIHKHIAANLTILGYRCVWADTYVIAMNTDGEERAKLEYLGDDKYKLSAMESRPIESIVVDLEAAGVPGWQM